MAAAFRSRCLMPDLNGKVAVVTGEGGARGIGEAICTKLAEYGAAVAVTNVDLAGAMALADDLTSRSFRAITALKQDVTS